MERKYFSTAKILKQINNRQILYYIMDIDPTSQPNPAMDIDLQAPPNAPKKKRGNPNLNKKRKKKYSRKVKGSECKTTTFDYKGAREQLNLPADANSQQIAHAIAPSLPNPPQPKSPLKAVVKAENKMLKAELEREQRMNALQAKTIAIKNKNNVSLKKRIRELSSLLKAEKKASRQMYNDAMLDVDASMADALAMVEESDAKEKELQKKMDDVQQATQDAVRAERKHASREMSRARQAHQAKIAKLDTEHTVSMREQETMLMTKNKQVEDKLNDAHDLMMRERKRWEAMLDKAAKEKHAAKGKSRAAVQQRQDAINHHITSSLVHERQIEEYVDYIQRLEHSRRQLLKDARASDRSRDQERLLANQRLEKLKATIEEKNVLRDKLARVVKAKAAQQEIIARYENMMKDANQKKQLELKKEYKVGRRGGASYPLWVVQVSIEFLVHGTPPSAVPANIATLYEMLYGKEPTDVPSAQFVRQIRAAVQVMGETITAIKLANAPAEMWRQLFFDATTRRQTPFQAVIVGLMDNGVLDPVVVSSCIFLEDESAETSVENMIAKAKIESLKRRLDRLREVMVKHYPEFAHLVPSSDEIDLEKLREVLLTSDTCNVAQKERHIFSERIGGTTYNQDCHNHLRNVHTNGMENAITERLKIILKDSIDEIDVSLRVSAVFSSYCRAWDKFFSLNANYVKGQGEHFAPWFRVNHPGELLFHVENAQGSRQDLGMMAAPGIYMNREYCYEYADYLLRIPKKRDNILLRNLVTLMRSEEMIAVSRLFSIFFISYCMPLRWLAGKTATLAEYKWGPVSMGRALDTLREKMLEIADSPELCLDEDFMMNMFKEFRDELPPFHEYHEFMFQKKGHISFGCKRSKSKVIELHELKEELFHPKLESNKATGDRVKELAKVAALAIVKELEDKKKATWKYLSISGSPSSWEHCPDEVKEKLLGCQATNDWCESVLGGTTHILQRFGRIPIALAAAISDINRNKYVKRVVGKPKKVNGKVQEEKQGLFHDFPEAL
ncbi:hypothetical protein ACHAXR_006982, partial [Thalassiosira sp. AJA248-18]